MRDFVCFVKQKTAYEMRISDWSSDVCSSDLVDEFVASFPRRFAHQLITHALFAEQKANFAREGTQGELIELPHAHGIAAAGPGAQRLCGGRTGYCRSPRANGRGQRRAHRKSAVSVKSVSVRGQRGGRP